MLVLRAVTPGHSRDTEDDGQHHCGVRFPVCGLRVPASCGRPDMLGIAFTARLALLSSVKEGDGWSCERDLSSARLLDRSSFRLHRLDRMVSFWHTGHFVYRDRTIGGVNIAADCGLEFELSSTRVKKAWHLNSCLP